MFLSLAIVIESFLRWRNIGSSSLCRFKEREANLLYRETNPSESFCAVLSAVEPGHVAIANNLRCWKSNVESPPFEIGNFIGLVAYSKDD